MLVVMAIVLVPSLQLPSWSWSPVGHPNDPTISVHPLLSAGAFLSLRAYRVLL